MQEGREGGDRAERTRASKEVAFAMADKGGVGSESESIADKYFVCTECLVEGNVQGFVDLFLPDHLSKAI